jgi:hypothetical protein
MNMDSNVPASTPPVLPTTTTPASAKTADAPAAYVPNEVRDRVRAVVNYLRNNAPDTGARSRMDNLLSFINPVTSRPERMPVTPERVITQPDRWRILENTVVLAIIEYGQFARGETAEPTFPALLLLERVMGTGIKKFGAYPKERNSVIHVLRSVDEQRQHIADTQARAEKAMSMKADKLDKEPE